MQIATSTDGIPERKILIGMITDPVVLGRISSKWKNGLFSNRWSNLIAGWCVEYYQKFRSPPGKAIEGLFASWSKKDRDPDTVKLINRFLSTLSEEYSGEGMIASDYLLDLAGKHFNRIKIGKLIESVQAELDSDKLGDAEAHLANHSRIELGQQTGVDVFIDRSAVFSTFEDTQGESIVPYSGGLSQFFGHSFERDSFISFIAPNKTGKSWWIMDVAWRAMVARKRVAYFVVGDLSERQMKLRLLTRAARRPAYSTHPNSSWPCQVSWPRSIEKPFDGEVAEVASDCLTYQRPLNAEQAWLACQEVMRSKVRSKESYFWLAVFPSGSISVLGIRSEIQNLERRGWVPDVVAIDYADTLAPLPGHREKRDQVNETWLTLRRLSQELHCCLVTGTQADSESFRRDLLDRKNFSEDRRKLDHVTGMVGINMTSREKEKGVYRLNWVARREGQWSPSRCCYVATCLPLGHPSVRSVY